MELRQLEYFVAVVEEANFTRAAARLHVAQPGVSAQVRKLERELGQELLDRSGRVVRLTEAGEALLPHARAALGSVEGARLAVDEVRGLVRGQVSVGIVASISSTALDIPGLLADFHEEFPAVGITLTEENSERMIEALREGRLDVALVGLGSDDHEGVETMLVYDDPLVIATRRDDPLADGGGSVSLWEVRDLIVIGLPKGTGLRAVMDAACAAAGFEPRISFEASAPEILAELVARGLGVAVLPESIVASYPSLRAVAISGAAPRGRIALAWRSAGPTNPATRAFMQRARDRFSSPAYET